MPTYEYLCSSCADRFEEFQSISAAPLTACPKCGSAVQRLISAGNGLIFKGSGFYITDYKTSNGRGAARESSKSTVDSKSGENPKSGESPKSGEKAESSGSKEKAGESSQASTSKN